MGATDAEAVAASTWGEKALVKVRQDGRTWGWACPCCLNYPGHGGYLTQSMALWDANEHIAMAHPDQSDLEDELEGLFR